MFALVLALCLAGCHSRARVTQLAPVDSLAWGDNPRGNLQQVVATALVNNELYALDLPDSLYVYSMATGQWARTLGGKGQGPGRLLMGRDIAAMPSGNLMVADDGNCRIQEVSPQGDCVNCFTAPMAVTLTTVGDTLYYGTHHDIRKLLPNGDTQPVLDLEPWLKNLVGSTWSFCVVHDYYVVHVFLANRFLVFSRAGQLQDVSFDEPPAPADQVPWGRPIAYGEGFLIPFVLTLDDDTGDEDSWPPKIEMSLLYYNLKGERLHTYRLVTGNNIYPQRGAWTLDGNRAYIADGLSGVIYVYNLK